MPERLLDAAGMPVIAEQARRRPRYFGVPLAEPVAEFTPPRGTWTGITAQTLPWDELVYLSSGHPVPLRQIFLLNQPCGRGATGCRWLWGGPGRGRWARQDGEVGLLRVHKEGERAAGMRRRELYSVDGCL